jgi:cytoskeletal protein CcmA (bactofilin family)
MKAEVMPSFTQDDLGRAEKNNLTLGAGVVFSGAILAKGRVIVHGVVDGDLDAGDLLVGVSGVITGKIRAHTMHIHGEVNRDVVCDGHVAIHTTGVVNGQFEYGELEIERGGRISGSLNPCGDI